MPAPPPASFDLDYLPAAVASTALPIVVCLFEQGSYTILPNLRCLRIDYREGPEPPVARFQYLTGDLLEANLGWPSQFEALWPIDAQGDYVALVDDRLVVLTVDPAGEPIVLFDGFAQIPQTDVGPQSQSVTFVALGVATRLWDNSITGRVQRNGDVPATIDGSGDIPVDLPCRFNPSDHSIAALGGYIGNCVAENIFTVSAKAGAPGGGYPVFIDPLLVERGFSETQYWYVAAVLKYLFAVQPSPEDADGNVYVEFPTFKSLDALMGCYSPPIGGQVLNVQTATSSNVYIRDYDAANKSVPEVVSDLLGYAGFVMIFVTDTGAGGLPQTSLQIRRRDAFDAAAPKKVYLAAGGSVSLDSTQNNATALHLARDCNGIVNAWDVESQLRQVEVTVYLAPGFQPNSGDEGNPAKFYKSNLATATEKERRMYRWYIADEVADGHWNDVTQLWNETGLDFSPIFPPDTYGVPSFVKRYRPGSKTLISKDIQGKPLKAVLEISFGVSAEDPSLVKDLDEDGLWFPIPQGHGWRLLDDRLGIELTDENVEMWQTGNSKAGEGGLVKGITWQTVPPEGRSFVLRLTTVIEDDYRMPIVAPRRVASPTKFSRWRSSDGKDHFQYCTIAPNSLYYAAQGGNGTDPVVIRDDTKAAQTHANQLRSAHEFPRLAGSVTIPFVTDYYQIADRVQIVKGRDANLQINVGVDQGEAPTYPWVTAFSWTFEPDRQQTVLQLSDRRAEERNY